MDRSIHLAIITDEIENSSNCTIYHTWKYLNNFNELYFYCYSEKCMKTKNAFATF